MGFSKNFTLYNAYCKSLFHFSKARVIFSLLLMMFLGLTGGVGLLMLIPLLQLIGFQNTGGNFQGFSLAISKAFNNLGIPLNLTSILLTYILIISIYALLRYFQAVINANIHQDYTIFWRSRLYRLLSYSEWLFIARNKSSDLAHILTNETRNIGFATNQLLVLFSTGIIISVHVVIAFFLSLEMTFVALACAILLSLFILPKNRKVYQTGRDMIKQGRDLFSAISEHLGGIKIAKSYGNESKHIQNFQSLDSRIKTANIKFIRIRAGTQLFYDIGGVIVFSLLFFFAFKIIQIPTATLLILLYIFARLLPKIAGLQQNSQHIIRSLPSFKTLRDLEDQCLKHQEVCEARSSVPFRIKKKIEFKNVYFRFNKDINSFILNNINLTIPAGQTVAVVGPSGAGKSTFADLLIGLITPERGEILLDGRPLSGERLFSWRNSIGYVPQDIFLFHDSIRSNLLWAKKSAIEKDLWEVLTLAEADKFVDQLPGGLDYVIGDRGAGLSGGEKQRISLARALLRKPSLLVLDEATSSLDEENTKNIQMAIKNLRPRLTTLIIAHRLSTAKMADQIFVFNNGQVIETGTWDELANNKNSKFAAIFKPTEIEKSIDLNN